MTPEVPANPHHAGSLGFCKALSPQWRQSGEPWGNSQLGWGAFYSLRFCVDFPSSRWHRVSHGPSNAGARRPQQRQFLLSRGKIGLVLPTFRGCCGCSDGGAGSRRGCALPVPVTEAGSALRHLPGCHRLCGGDTPSPGARKTGWCRGHRAGLVPASQGGFARGPDPASSCPHPGARGGTGGQGGCLHPGVCDNGQGTPESVTLAGHREGCDTGRVPCRV